MIHPGVRLMVASLCLAAGLLAGMALNIFVFLPVIFCIAGAAFLLGLWTDVSHGAALGMQAAIGLQMGYGLALLARCYAGRIFIYWLARKECAVPPPQGYFRKLRGTGGPQTSAR